MRIIKVEIPATLQMQDPDNTLQSPEVRQQVAAYVRDREPNLAESITVKAREYFSADYSVFTVLRPDGDKLQLATEIWVVDPSIRSWHAVFARRGWLVILPVLARVTESVLADGLQPVTVVTKADAATVSIYGAMRAWRHPVILGPILVALTSGYWLFLHRYLMAFFG